MNDVAGGDRQLPVGVRQRLRDRGSGGRAAGSAEFAAALRLRAVCGADQRVAVHRAASKQSAQLAVSDPTDGSTLGEVPCGGCRVLAHRPARRGSSPARADALGPDSDTR